MLTALAQYPGVSEAWLLTGEGEPLADLSSGTIPVAMDILPGPPNQLPQLLTGQRYPVAPTDGLPGRYGVRIEARSPLLRAAWLHLSVDDLLIIETDQAATRNLTIITRSLCVVAVRHEKGTTCIWACILAMPEGLSYRPIGHPHSDPFWEGKKFRQRVSQDPSRKPRQQSTPKSKTAKPDIGNQYIIDVSAVVGVAVKLARDSVVPRS